MNANRLLAHYEKIADAPDAVQRLRRFILDLAVRGKLVEQDPNDEPASELLKRIAAERERLVKAREIRKGKPFPVIGLDEFPFETPCSWEWVRIRNVMSDRGQTIPDRDFTYIDVTAINKEVGCIENAKVISASKAPSRARKIVRMGDVLYSCVRPYLLNIAIVESEISPSPIASTAFAVLNGFGLVLPRFQWIVLRSPFMIAGVEDKMRGQAYPAINDSDFAILPFPLPPLAEQHRIVAKADELMALCDRLEEGRTERETTRDRLTTASLARLNEPDPDLGVFQKQAAFALDNLIPLTTRPDQIKALRQTVLNLAVRGKLVPQDPNDEPTSEVGARRKIAVSEAKPFELPESWVWVKVGAVADSRLGKMLDKAKNKGTPRKYLRNINVRWFDFDLSNLLRMRFEDSELSEFALRGGDVLICEGGEPGRAAVWDDREAEIYFQKAVHRVRFPDFVDSEFFVRTLRASADDGRLAEYFTGTGIKHFTGKGLAAYLFPLPPLVEQHRIVAKIDELMVLCDRLEASLANGDDTRCRLLDALLHEALARSEEKIGRDISMIAQELPAKPPGPPKVLTGSTTIGLSPK